MTAIGLLKNSATMEVLKGAWKRAGRDKTIRRPFTDLPLGKELSGVLGGANPGPITIPNRKGVAKNTRGKFFAKGDISDTIDKLKGITGIKTRAIVGKAKQGANYHMNLHESDELKEFNSGMPQSSYGQKYGHHSLAKILGSESNRHITAKGKALRSGTGKIKDFRSASGEKNAFDSFALKAIDGSKPFKYGEGPRTSRAYRKAMYKNEIGMPKATKKEIAQVAKEQRRLINEAIQQQENSR